MTKCIGCGITLQYDDDKKEGYTNNIKSNICNRCFNIKNYNLKDNIESLSNEDIIKKINCTKCANLFLCDLFSLNDDVINIFNKLNNPKVLIISKFDTLAKSIDAINIIERIKNNYGVKEVLLVSIKSGFGIKEIKECIKTFKRVLLCGPTSSGKSSLINYLYNTELTVSSNKNTTRDIISMNVDGITIFDAPGFDHNNSNIVFKGNVIPRTIKLKKDYELHIEDYVIYPKNDCNITLFCNNNINISTKKINESFKESISFDNYTDILISNIGFIYFKESNTIYFNKNVVKRKSVIGGSNGQD